MLQIPNILLSIGVGILAFELTRRVGLKSLKLSDITLWKLFFPSLIEGYKPDAKWLGTLPQNYRVVLFIVAVGSVLVAILDPSVTFPLWLHFVMIGGLLGTIVYALRVALLIRAATERMFRML